MSEDLNVTQFPETEEESELRSEILHAFSRPFNHSKTKLRFWMHLEKSS